MGKTALITGVSGQDGAYLSKLLAGKGYRVIGQVAPGAPARTERLAELGIAGEVEIVAFDLLASEETQNALDRLRPDELYNLAGPSSVAFSFAQPTLPLEVNAVAAARLLEASRLAIPEVRFFQPSTAEMFGAANSSPQNEDTPFLPRSPYAVAKLFSHWQTAIYREAYGVFAVRGIMFNHESPLRRRIFVTRKITAGLAEVKHGRRARISLGNLEAQRDWGFAGDYVAGMWLAMTQDKADDFVFASGRSTTVRRFAELTAECLGIALEWSGSGISEIGVDRRTGRTIIDIDAALFRPAELDATVGDSRKARERLEWSPATSLESLVAMMAEADERRTLENTLLD